MGKRASLDFDRIWVHLIGMPKDQKIAQSIANRAWNTIYSKVEAKDAIAYLKLEFAGFEEIMPGVYKAGFNIIPKTGLRADFTLWKSHINKYRVCFKTLSFIQINPYISFEEA